MHPFGGGLMKARYLSVLIFLFFLSLLIFTNNVYTSTDVTSFVQINKSGAYFNRRTGQTSYDVTLTNISSETIQKPVYVAIENLSPGEVTVANPDGYTAGGDPYYDYSALIAGAAFDPGGISSPKKWIFNNPNRLRFTYTTVVYGPYSVNDPPVADAGMDQNALIEVPVYLDGSGSYDPDGDLITFQWTMTGSPSGSSAALSDIDTASPHVTPDISGDYTFQLTVNDSQADSAPDEVIIHASVSNVAPNADAGPDQSVLVDSTVFLDGSGSFDPDNTPGPLTYLWTFTGTPLNSIHNGATLTGISPVFIPDIDGTFDLDLDVNDGALSDHDQVSIFAGTSNQAPNADAGADQIVWQLSQSVSLDGSASFDSDNGPSVLTYQWSFVSLPVGSTLTNTGIVNAATSIASFTPDVYGAYLLNLEVNDGALTDNDHTLVIVTTENNPPQIDITNPVDGAFINITKPYITITFSDDESGIDTDSFYAEINGVDSTSLFTVTDTGAGYQVTTDLPVGDNAITASISDNAGNTGNATSNFRIGILRAIPGASPTSGPSPLTVRFTTDGEDPAGTIQIFRWDFDGNGTWDTYDTVARDYNHTYNNSGVYNATLYVQSSTGKTATASITITVENNPPVATADVVPSNGEVPLTVQMYGLGQDSDGNIVLYEWDFDGDGTYDWSSSTTGSTTYTYDTPGTYQAVFRVTDNNGLSATATAPTTIVRAGPPGSPTATAAANPTSGNAPLNVNLNCTATDPDNDVVLYEWDFDGDGTYDWSSSSTGNTSHIYNDAGTHVASCRVTDSTALTGIDNILISVNIQVSLSIQKDTVGFLPDGGTTGMTANASSQYSSSYSPDKAIDGNTGTYWVSCWYCTSGEWFEVSFDTPQKVSGFSVTWYSSSYIMSRAKIEAFNSSGDVLYDQEADFSGSVSNVSLPNVENVSRIRLTTINYTSSYYIIIKEFDVNSTPMSVGQPEPTGTNIDTSISAATQVSILIKDSDGNVVRTLVNNESRDTGSYSDYWDVKDDYGIVANDGVYYAVLQYIVDGQVKSYDLTNSTGGTRYSFPQGSACNTRDNIGYGTSFSPYDDNFLPINFRLCKASEVTLFVGPLWSGGSATRIRTILNRKVLPAGSHTVYWDGLDDQGNIAHPSPGDSLILGMWRYTLSDNSIYVTGQRPVISNVISDPNYFNPLSNTCTANGNSINVTYTVSEDVDTVKLSVVSLSTKNTVRIIQENSVSSGENHIFWDGRNTNGDYVEAGDYQLILTATDAQGNESMLTAVNLIRIAY